MAVQTESRFQIIDSQQRHVGDIAIERSEEHLVFGRFTPGRAFSEVEHLFREFEEAANLQAVHRVDELDAVMHLRSMDGSQTDPAEPTAARLTVNLIDGCRSRA